MMPTITASYLTLRHLRVLLMAMLGMAVGLNGMAFYAVGALIHPLQLQFGWSRASTSGVVACLMAGQMLTAPWVGPALARFGVRAVLTISMLAMAVGYALLGTVSGLTEYYLVWLLVASGGGGTTAVLWSRVILTQFSHRRGLFLGLALCGTGIAGMSVPVGLGWVIEAAGWRVGCLALGLCAALLALPVAFGVGYAGLSDGRSDAGEGVGAGLGEACRMPSFWVLQGAFAVIAMCVAALIVHLVPLLIDRGLSPGRAAAVAGSIGFAALGGRAASGALLDRLHPPLVAACVVLLPVGASLWLMQGGAWGPGLLIGLAAGAEIDLLAYLCGWCFGLRESARIHGWLVMGFCVGSAIGPGLAGFLRDVNGVYTPALIGGSLLLAAASLSLLTLRRAIPR